MKDAKLDAKTRNFLAEIYAYTQLVLNNRQQARTFYEQAAADPAQTYPVSYQRARAMLSRL